MIWKVLSATTAVFVLVTAYFVFVPADSNVLTGLVSAASSLPYWNAIAGGVYQISSNAFTGFVIGIVIALIAIVLYLAASAGADENTEEMF